MRKGIVKYCGAAYYMSHFQMRQFKKQFHCHPLIGGWMTFPKDNDKLVFKQTLSFASLFGNQIAADEKVYVRIKVQGFERVMVTDGKRYLRSVGSNSCEQAWKQPANKVVRYP